VRALVQRVSEASVSVDGEVVGTIGPGLCVLVGVTHDDGAEQVAKLATKLPKLRVFDDDEGLMNRSVLDVGGELLVVSQFTLYGNTAKGNRPSWTLAARPEQAEPLIDDLVTRLRDQGLTVATGRFQALMSVALVNDGPTTVLLEVEPPRPAP
jgi:D-aminoacyl-tRNA deacylase